MEQKTDLDKPDIKHWLWQIIPPMVILAVLFGTTSGTSLVFLVGLFIFPVLISVISLIIKLFRFNKRKYFLLRPFLTIFSSQ